MTNRKLKVLISMIFACQTLVGRLIFHEDTGEIYIYFVVGHSGTYSTILSFSQYKTQKIAKKGIISTTDASMKKHWRMTKSVALFVLVFVVCRTPFFMYIFVLQLCQFMDINFERMFYPENLKIFYFCLLCGFTTRASILFFIIGVTKISGLEYNHSS